MFAGRRPALGRIIAALPTLRLRPQVVDCVVWEAGALTRKEGWFGQKEERKGLRMD